MTNETAQLPPGTEDLFTPERMADVQSGDRDRVRRGIAGLPRAVMETWLATDDGEKALRDAVAAMPSYYIGNTIDDESRLARWKISRPPGAPIEFDLELTPAGAAVRDAGSGSEPHVTMTMDGVSFAEMASLTKSGMDLLLAGKLQITGDVQVAMMMEFLFGLAES